MMAQDEDQDSAESEDESVLDTTLDAGESFAKEELGQMAWVVAGGSLAMGSVLPSLPGEVGALSDINDLVWDTGPLDLELQNEEKLRPWV